MKKLVALVLTLVLLLSLTACGEKVSKKFVSYGESMVSVADDYLDGKITAEETNKKLTSLCEMVDLQTVETNEDALFSIVVDTFKTAVEVCILKEERGEALDKEEYNKLLEYRNEIAAYIGVKQR